MFKTIPVDVRLEHQRTGAALADAVFEFAVDFDVHRLAAVCAARLDSHREILASQPPLHEGRRYRVFRSGGVEPLSGIEHQPVRRFGGGDGKRPAHLAFVIANEEKQVLFQVIQNLCRLPGRQAQRI